MTTRHERQRRGPYAIELPAALVEEVGQRIIPIVADVRDAYAMHAAAAELRDPSEVTLTNVRRPIQEAEDLDPD